MSPSSAVAAAAEIPAAVPVDPQEAARAAGLHHVGDDRPGIRRRRRGKGWSYQAPDGSLVRDPAVRQRIAALAIPPAWTEVWICPDPRGHLQATGRDARGRKQYRYHPRWREVRDATKFQSLRRFGEALPRIRRQVARDLRRRGLPRDKVLATVVRLLETTCIRVGNEEYRRDNSSHGLTTLRDRHVEISGARVRFRFRGKGGKLQEASISDRRLARIVRDCREIPGYELFQYLDGDGRGEPITSQEVNAYLKESGGGDFTAKDFRTWLGSVHALITFWELGRPEKAAVNGQVVACLDRVAEQLANTRAVCRQFYVHPGIIGAYEEGWLFETLGRRFPPAPREGLDGPEEALLSLLGEIEKRAG